MINDVYGDVNNKGEYVGLVWSGNFKDIHLGTLLAPLSRRGLGP